MTTTSPVCAVRSAAAVVADLWASARRCSVFSTSSSSGSATSRSRLIREKSIGSISGSTSRASVYSRSPCSPIEVTSIFGAPAGRSPRSSITDFAESLTASSSTSPRSAAP